MLDAPSPAVEVLERHRDREHEHDHEDHERDKRDADERDQGRSRTLPFLGLMVEPFRESRSPSSPRESGRRSSSSPPPGASSAQPHRSTRTPPTQPGDLWEVNAGHTQGLHDHPHQYARHVLGFFQKPLGELAM